MFRGHKLPGKLSNHAHLKHAFAELRSKFLRSICNELLVTSIRQWKRPRLES